MKAESIKFNPDTQSFVRDLIGSMTNAELVHLLTKHGHNVSIFKLPHSTVQKIAWDGMSLRDYAETVITNNN